MRIEFTIDFDLSENQKQELIENPLNFLYSYIDIKEIDNSNYNVVSVVCHDIMPYRAYGFSNQMVDWLNQLGIYRIEKICKYTYLQVKSSQVKEIVQSRNLYQKGDFIPTLIDVMKKRNLNFADISIDDLVPIKNINVSANISNALKNRGINFLQDIPLFTKSEVESTGGLGVKFKKELEEALIKCGVWYKSNDNCDELSGVYLDINADNADYGINYYKLSYGDYGLSRNMIDWLNVLEIQSIDLLANLSYRDFRLSRDKKNKNSFKYIDDNDINILIDKMSEKNVNFKDIKTNDFLPISNCGLYLRTESCLKRFGILYLQDIPLFSKGEISNIRNLTKLCISELDGIMNKYGLKYRDE